MEKRIDKIRKKIEADGEVSVTELSRLYGVTEETIRRDFDKLKDEGVLTRTFGGAVLNSGTQRERIHFFRRRLINMDAKRKIASISARSIGNVKTIMADNSTTVAEAVKLLKHNEELTMISFSSCIFQELEESKMKIISTGGVYDEVTQSFQGGIAKTNISKYNVDAALLSCKALDIKKGIMDSTEEEAGLKSKMASRAAKVILLCDHTKFGGTAFFDFLPWDKVSCIITDKCPGDEWISFCAQCGISLLWE